LASFQKTDFGVSSTEGARNTKIGFIMRIADSAMQKMSGSAKRRHSSFGF